jgi:hypothetical protein
MSTIATPASNEANTVDAFASTRQNYERFAFLLLRVGHIPDLELTHLDFRVLLFLLGQKPGHYAAHHQTVARACDSNATSIKQAFGRLRAAGVVQSELIPPHHVLPTGRFARTNVNRYWVHLPALAALLQTPRTPASTLRNSAPSTGLNSASSYGTADPNEQQPLPPTPPPTLPLRCSRILREVEEAAVPIEISEDLERIRESWKRLGLGDFDRRSTRALENRLAEGATLEQIEAAVAGASVDEWLRRRAKVPFAVVFASVASVQRFAHEGRKVIDRQATKARSGPQEGQEERIAGDCQAFETIDPMVPTADELRRLLPKLKPVAASATTMDDVQMPLASQNAGVSRALGETAPTIAKAFGRPPRAVDKPAFAAPTQQPPMRYSGPPPELSALLKALAGSMHPGRDARNEETPQDRRLREQADFDRRRLELVATLRSLEK